MRASVLLLASIGALGCSRSGLELLSSGPHAEPDGGVMDAGMDSGSHEPCRWSFAPPVKYKVSGYPVDVAIGDFDGDHVNDVLTVNGTSGQIALLGNLGNGELALRDGGPVGTSPFVFATADFTGDGSLDLAVAYLSHDLAGTSSVSIYLNDGHGRFTSDIAYLNTTGTFGIVAGDFDRDGYPDIAIASGGMTAMVMLNKGNGTFQLGPQFPTGSYASYLTAADFDHDGALDLGFAGTFSVAVLLNRGNAEFPSPIVYDNTSACNYVGPLIAGDLTGDGYPELVRSCYQGGNLVTVRDNRGDGTLSEEELPYEVGEWPQRLVMGDFTGQGRNDLAVANSWAYANTVSVLENLGDGTFAPQRKYEAGGPITIAAGDLNGDGHLDLATAGTPDYPTPDGTVSVLLSTCE